MDVDSIGYQGEDRAMDIAAVQGMHVCSAPVENHRGQWLAATEFLEGRNISKRGPLAQGQTGTWNERKGRRF